VIIIVILAVSVLVLRWLHHAVADHHGHLKALRVIRPRTRVPATRHDSWWHGLPRARRAAVDAALLLAAACAGLAWQLSPQVAAVVLILAAAAVVIVAAVRRMQAAHLRRSRED
jgi:hypothetical protein